VHFWWSKLSFAIVTAHVMMVQWALLASLFAFTFVTSIAIKLSIIFNQWFSPSNFWTD
jgi:hypothetical protein